VSNTACVLDALLGSLQQAAKAGRVGKQQPLQLILFAHGD
jgi:hypothetical protein